MKLPQTFDDQQLTVSGVTLSTEHTLCQHCDNTNKGSGDNVLRLTAPKGSGNDLSFCLSGKAEEMRTQMVQQLIQYRTGKPECKIYNIGTGVGGVPPDASLDWQPEGLLEHFLECDKRREHEANQMASTELMGVGGTGGSEPW